MAPRVRDITDDIRVLICSMPDLQSDVIAQVVGAEPDMSVALRGAQLAELPWQIGRTNPDVVVASTADLAEPSQLLVALGRYPDIGLLLVGTGPESHFVTARMCVPAEGDWAATLVQLIRASVQAKDGNSTCP